MKLARKNQHFDLPNHMQWQPIHKPLIYKNPTMYIVVWVAVQVILYAILLPLFIRSEDRIHKNYNELLIVLIIMIAGMITHEFIHILFVPATIFSQDIYIRVAMMMGCIPAVGFYYTGIVTRKRKQMMLMMPFIIISVIPGTILYFSSLSNRYLFILIYLNACGCFNDIISTIDLFRYPSKSLICMSYWNDNV